MDRQSEAYRENPEENHASEIEVASWAEREHEPLTSIDDLKWPEDYEDDDWDQGREGPKSIPEARAELNRRIADESAPDDIQDVDAYDHLGGE